MNSRNKHIRFRSFDGVELEGTAVPATSPSETAVLLVHGIDSDREELGFYSRMAAALAGAGYWNLRFDWRCYGYDAARPIGELTLAGVANDISAAADQLRQWSQAKRIAAIATSFGGGVTTYWARSSAGSDLAALVLIAPVLDYAHDYVTLEHLGTARGITETAAVELQAHGSLKTSGRPFSRAMIAELPHFGARPAPDLPILLVHGNADKAVPFDLSVAFAAEFDNVELEAVPGTDHGFATPGDEDLQWPSTLETHDRVYKRIVRWLQRVEREVR